MPKITRQNSAVTKGAFGALFFFVDFSCAVNLLLVFMGHKGLSEKRKEFEMENFSATIILKGATVATPQLIIRETFEELESFLTRYNITDENYIISYDRLQIVCGRIYNMEYKNDLYAD